MDQWKKSRKSRDKIHTPMNNLSLTNEAKYTVEKRQSFQQTAGNTGQLDIKKKRN